MTDPQTFRSAPREVPPVPRGAHYHACRACDNYLVCYAAPDQCPLPDHWICEPCDLADVEAYLTAQETGGTP